MKTLIYILILVVGILLIFLGLLNIVDDARVRTYDITSILAGVGFSLLGVTRFIPARDVK